jgi:Arc/MetJ-type ribon-helix-helix transcriptional regulator
MKSLSIDLPDSLAKAIESYVKAGLFRSEMDVLLAAISEFVRRNKIDLMERFAHEDIEWAKKEARTAKETQDETQNKMQNKTQNEMQNEIQKTK